MGQQNSVNHDSKYLAYRRCVANVNDTIGVLRPGSATKIRCEMKVKPEVEKIVTPFSVVAVRQDNSELTSEYQAQILADLSNKHVVVHGHKQFDNTWEISVFNHLNVYNETIQPHKENMGNKQKMWYWTLTKK